MDYNKTFYWCVKVLQIGAKRLNMTYEEINIWIFCIIEPIVFVAMVAWIIWLMAKLRRYIESYKKPYR